mmetsp:Transcript_58687/g.143525  ORF Transcript_58687/g.143525 Transcript_58687/m.143525 type:complete len:535 (+) Transcript_58687:223-1827(+)
MDMTTGEMSKIVTSHEDRPNGARMQSSHSTSGRSRGIVLSAAVSSPCASSTITITITIAMIMMFALLVQLSSQPSPSLFVSAFVSSNSHSSTSSPPAKAPVQGFTRMHHYHHYHHHHHHHHHQPSPRSTVLSWRQQPPSIHRNFSYARKTLASAGTAMSSARTTGLSSSSFFFDGLALSSSSSVALPPPIPSAATAAITGATTPVIMATLLGYAVGFLSLILYTPIAVRIWKQQHADGLSETTWWFKFASYTTTILYNVSHHYPISTYIETLIISIQSAVILCLVARLQQPQPQQPQSQQSMTGQPQRRQRRRQWFVGSFQLKCILYICTTIWGLTVAPPQLIAVGQFVAAGLNSAALVPQFLLNFRTKSKGDYSPLTAGLAAIGCAIRLFTTTTLSGADHVLLLSFGIALVVNTALFSQIIYYGVVEERLTLRQVFEADISPTGTSTKQHRRKSSSSSSSSSFDSTIFDRNDEGVTINTTKEEKQGKWEGSSTTDETDDFTTAADLSSNSSSQEQQEQQRELLLELGPIKIRR